MKEVGMWYEKMEVTPSEQFSWKRRAKSFVYAFSGVRSFFKYGHNARIHLAAALLVFLLALIVHISSTDWVVIIFAVALVWITEMINTTLEKSMDMISPEWHPQVKQVKDIAAGAVLVAAVAALSAGCFIFIPKIFAL